MVLVAQFKNTQNSQFSSSLNTLLSLSKYTLVILVLRRLRFRSLLSFAVAVNTWLCAVLSWKYISPTSRHSKWGRIFLQEQSGVFRSPDDSAVASCYLILYTVNLWLRVLPFCLLFLFGFWYACYLLPSWFVLLMLVLACLCYLLYMTASMLL